MTAYCTVRVTCDWLDCCANTEVRTASPSEARRTARTNRGWAMKDGNDYCPEHVGVRRVKVRAIAQSLFPDVQPDKPIGYILPSVFTGTNAELMRAVAPFYLTGSVMDCTYGEGNWWKLHRPDPFVAHDLYKLDGVDFTALPEDDGTYDTVCFDPPYTISGGASTANLGSEFQTRYGIGDANIGREEGTSRWRTVESLITDGLAEALRVSRQCVLVKCMEFAQGAGPIGRDFHDIPHIVTTHALDLGWFKHDQIVHHTGAGPGGHNIFDPKRARRHHSYLLVFKKDTRR